MTFDNKFPGGAFDVLNPGGDEAVVCFWRKRDSNQVQKLVSDRTVLVGNNYYDPTSYDMELPAHYVARTLWANPQIERLVFAASFKEMTPFVTELNKHLPVKVHTDFLEILSHTSKDYPLPEVTPPDSYLSRNTSKLLYNESLTDLHSDALGTILRYGTTASWGDKARSELTNMVCEWQYPFNLGGRFKDKEEEFIKYATDSLGVEIGSDYTYLSRYDENSTTRDPLSRKNWTPIWLPTDSNHDDPPCMVGIYTRGDSVTAVFRAHNILNAWPKNMFLVKHIGEEALGKDSLKSATIVSLQAGLRLDNLEKAKELAGKGSPQINSKGGSWSIAKEGDVLVAKLMNNGKIVEEFKGTADSIATDITIARAWPQDYSECAWIGKELGRLE